MSNGAFGSHAHTHHPQWLLGNLVLLLCIKTAGSLTANYNQHILVPGDVHRLQFDIKTKKQKIKYLAVLN